MKLIIGLFVFMFSHHAFAMGAFAPIIDKCTVTNTDYIPSTIEVSVFSESIFQIGDRVAIFYSFPEMTAALGIDPGSHKGSFVSTFELVKDKTYKGKITNLDALSDAVFNFEEGFLEFTENEEVFKFTGDCRLPIDL